MAYNIGTFDQVPINVGVPFPKLEKFSTVFSGIFLYEKTILQIVVYLFTCKVKTIKINFLFCKQCSQDNTFSFHSTDFCTLCYYFAYSSMHWKKKIIWEKYVTTWKWILKCTAHSQPKICFQENQIQSCALYALYST